MESPNHTSLDSSVFVLMGIPGLEQFHLWLSLPVCLLGTATVVGNITILAVIATEPALHKPMYLFLCMLSTVDLAASFSTVPKLLAILWCGAGRISASACLAQMFFIHAFCMMESTVLLAMAFDRYVAICHPLRYTTILTDTIIARIGVVAMVRGSILMLPCPFLIQRLSFCQSHVIPHTYCEHMAVVKLACGDTRPNRVYGLTAALLVIGVDLFCIGLFYSLIARAVLRLSSHEARSKALGTCGSHACVILISYTPALFSFFTHRFGHHVPLHIHILLANVYLLFPPALNPMVYGEALHWPMYYFLAFLPLTDASGCTTVFPNILCIFWLSMESDVLMLMALCRFVTICYSLCYSSLVAQIVKNLPAIVFPTAKATSFNTLVVECSQTCCEHMSLATLSCGNIKNNAIYDLIVTMVTGGLDIFCIFMSYTILIHVVGNLSSADARHKDFSTCISYIRAVVITYVPAFFTHHFGEHSILHHIHILIAKLYLLLPPTLNPIVY
ncbi:hypothetical protein FD754_022998 [Muntiacus muntjak]|uniref:G-protein coupled receptors family 1 profile domain-containing protein n=1 Tax=Muntiacus muntjak TaxID=9888 RepID=A0A5N3UUZ5_MUNMU|nr:hypothetical protein FD754_022999 [Muntiacus muntjak]KAB0340601.1 hypothetical protein FD754_022998 [Muntiacus muntjak]